MHLILGCALMSVRAHIHTAGKRVCRGQHVHALQLEIHARMITRYYLLGSRPCKIMLAFSRLLFVLANTSASRAALAVDIRPNERRILHSARKMCQMSVIFN